MFSEEWAALVGARNYSYLWLPDDDIAASSCNITRFLDLLEERQLLLAQAGGRRGSRPVCVPFRRMSEGRFMRTPCSAQPLHAPSSPL